MRSRSWTVVAALVIVSVAGAAPAAAQGLPLDNVRYYFTCPDEMKLRNLSGAAPWSALRPSRSYTQGAGCGFFDSGLGGEKFGGPIRDAVFEGTHRGPVSQLTVELHDLLYEQDWNLNGSMLFAVALEVDGATVLDTSRDDAAVEATPTVSSSGLSASVRFSVNNLKVADDAEHTYRLTIGQYYVDTVAAWVFGATEIPAGIEFNPLRTVLPRLRASG